MQETGKLHGDAQDIRTFRAIYGGLILKIVIGIAYPPSTRKPWNRRALLQAALQAPGRSAKLCAVPSCAAAIVICARPAHLASFPIDGVGLNPVSLDSAMRTTQQFSITLPNEMAELIRTKVASGEYASESEVIRDGLRTLAARDRAIEAWLRDEVVPAAEALRAGPARALTPEQVRAHLAKKRSGAA